MDLITFRMTKQNTTVATLITVPGATTWSTYIMEIFQVPMTCDMHIMFMIQIVIESNFPTMEMSRNISFVKSLIDVTVVKCITPVGKHGFLTLASVTILAQLL